MDRSGLKADVVIIGCGAAGSVVAKELAEAGVYVVVLEAGRRFNPEADYVGHQREFPADAARAFEPEDPRRDLYTTGPLGFRYERVKGVGGSTVVSWGVSPRLHESDFQTYSRDGVGKDWPITYQDLEPFYGRVEEELGMAGPEQAHANPFDSWRSKAFPTPAHPYTKSAQIFVTASKRLGLHPYPPALAMPTLAWDGRPACIGAGACGFGCRTGAKSSADVTYLRKAELTGKVSVLTQCTAKEILVDRDGGKATGVVYFNARGQEEAVQARAVVVAGNAIETPRLLLLSRSSRYPQGLANSSGLVGKYLTEHIDGGMRARVSEPLESWKGVPVSAMLQDYYESNKKNVFARGWLLEVATGGCWPVNVARRIKGWGSAHKAEMKRQFGHEFEVYAQGEQIPDIRNEVTLDPEVTDQFGMPVPKLTSQARGNDLAMLPAIRNSMNELLNAAGVEILSEWSHKPGGSGHCMGTCRMGDKASEAVVDRWGRTHDVSNLFLVDGSTFVTAGSAHPTLTLMALATRTSFHMIETAKQGGL